jgi:hypothetical protein
MPSCKKCAHYYLHTTLCHNLTCHDFMLMPFLCDQQAFVHCKPWSGRRCI